MLDHQPVLVGVQVVPGLDLATVDERETHQRRRGREEALQFAPACGVAEAPLSEQARATYERHRPERTPLYPLVVEHLERLLARARSLYSMIGYQRPDELSRELLNPADARPKVAGS